MTRVLFFDDNAYRHKIFKSRTIGCIVDHAYNVSEAINFLQNFDIEYDYIFLDYDLIDENGLPSLFSGLDVAKYIINNKDKLKIGKIIVHSLNRIQGFSMAEKLIGAGFNVIHSIGSWDKVIYKDGKIEIEDRWKILENE